MVFHGGGGGDGRRKRGFGGEREEEVLGDKLVTVPMSLKGIMLAGGG